MRMILDMSFPNEPFNSLVKEGAVGDLISAILEDQAPEHVWFSGKDGQRGVLMVVDVPSASDIPRLAEPWFLAFDADIDFRVAMTAEDLGKAGLDDLGKKWN